VCAEVKAGWVRLLERGWNGHREGILAMRVSLDLGWARLQETIHNAIESRYRLTRTAGSPDAAHDAVAAMMRHADSAWEGLLDRIEGVMVVRQAEANVGLQNGVRLREANALLEASFQSLHEIILCYVAGAVIGASAWVVETAVSAAKCVEPAVSTSDAASDVVGGSSRPPLGGDDRHIERHIDRALSYRGGRRRQVALGREHGEEGEEDGFGMGSDSPSFLPRGVGTRRTGWGEEEEEECNHAPESSTKAARKAQQAPSPHGTASLPGCAVPSQQAGGGFLVPVDAGLLKAPYERRNAPEKAQNVNVKGEGVQRAGGPGNYSTYVHIW